MTIIPKGETHSWAFARFGEEDGNRLVVNEDLVVMSNEEFDSLRRVAQSVQQMCDALGLDGADTPQHEGTPTPAPRKESDTSTPESRAEAIGKALGTALAPLALLNARPGDKPPEVHVNIWTIH